jgi:hypothetical protein
MQSPQLLLRSGFLLSHLLLLVLRYKCLSEVLLVSLLIIQIWVFLIHLVVCCSVILLILLLISCFILVVIVLLFLVLIYSKHRLINQSVIQNGLAPYMFGPFYFLLIDLNKFIIK